MRRHVLRQFRKSGRDFFCALIVFGVLAAAVTMDREVADPVALFALAANSLSSELPGSAAAVEAFNTPGNTPGSATPGSASGLELHAFVTSSSGMSAESLKVAWATMGAAVLFSIIVAFNLAFVRHLRRVHASSRRGAWRGD